MLKPSTTVILIVVLFLTSKEEAQILNFHIIKVNLKNGEARYRTVLTQSDKGIKSKTFRRKQDARTWGTRAVIENQEYEAKGISTVSL